MILISEILKGRHKEYPLDDKMLDNLGKLLLAVNSVRAAWGKPMTVTSGYRPGKYNTNAGGATNSAHLTCEAIDIADPKGELARWILGDLRVIEGVGLYMEDPARTRGWVHLQTRPTKDRVFKP